MVYRKLIKYIMIIISIVCYISPVNATKNNNIMSDMQLQWDQEYLPLFTESEYSVLLKSGELLKSKTLSSSLSKLRGAITNKFGIRDDILEYIMRSNPAHDAYVMRAAIILSQDKHMIYYGNVTPDDALKFEDNIMLVKTCLGLHMLNKQNLVLTRGMDRLMRNTESRNTWMRQTDKNLFSWKVLGSGLSVADEISACKKGEF